MIFRKPYAILIKYFKLIHAVLSVLMILLALNLYSMYQFINSYLEQGFFQQIVGVVAKEFKSIAFFWLFLILAIASLISFLLRHKEKPTKLYLIIIIFYLTTLVPLILSLVGIDSIQFDQANVQFLSITKDLLMLYSYLSVIFILMIISRAVGFNLKKFNFQKDLAELAIDEKDREEFEVDLELDAEDFQTKLRRRLRLFSYVYQENKTFFKILIIGFMALIIFSFYLYFGVINKIYSENSNFKADNFRLRVLDSYQLKTSSSGSLISQENFFVIVNLRIQNLSQEDRALNYENIYLNVVGQEKLEIHLANLDQLAEFGYPYYPETILKTNEVYDYFFVYKVPNEYEQITMRLDVLDKINKTENIVNYKYKTVNLKTKDLKKEKLISTKKLEEELSLEKSLLKDTKIKINNLEIAEKFYHKYFQYNSFTKEQDELTKVIKAKKTNRAPKAVAKIEYELTQAPGVNPKAYDKFFERYSRITYYLKDKEYQNTEVLYSLDSIKGQYEYIEIPEDVLKADKIYLDIVIRDSKYRYLIKE